MLLLSVNIGEERVVGNGRSSWKSGIHKQPVGERVRISCSGLSGDRICDTENHGGADQAVYVYGTPDYEWWSEELGRELTPGTFGENLTISGLESARARIGDRFLVASAVLEVTAPRIPCATLAARMEDPTFVKRFRWAGRPGLYCRVVREGEMRADDEVTLQPYQGETITVIEMFRDFFDPRPSEEKIRCHLAAPIAVRARIERETQLKELLARRDEKVSRASALTES